jgi:galactokinase/mevalonate kinase-like predicted kinase
MPEIAVPLARTSVTHHRKEVNKRTIIRSKAPLRISFAGGGTDLPQYYREHGGAVLSTTINRYAHVTLYPRQSGEIRLRSLDLGTIVRYRADQEPTFDGVLDLAKAAIRRMGVDLGFELDIYTEAPRGSGLATGKSKSRKSRRAKAKSSKAKKLKRAKRSRKRRS